MPRQTIDNSCDVLNSRDVINKLEEMDDEQTDLTDAVREAQEAVADDPSVENAETLKEAAEALEEWKNDNADELTSLREFVEEGESCACWHEGTTLVRESHWKEYVPSLLDDLGGLPKDLPSYVVIDWEATGEALRADWSVIEWDDVTYYVQ